MPVGTSKRIDYLEGLRGLAALLIVLHHYAQAFISGVFSKNQNEFHLPLELELWLYNTPLKLPLSGSVWLYIFLILSGLVITYSFYQKQQSFKWLANLGLNRYFRLIGPILVTGLLIFGAMKLGLGFNDEAAEISGSSWWLAKQWQFEPNFLQMLRQEGVQVFIKVLPIEVAYNSSLWVIPYFFLGTYLVAGLLALGKLAGKWRYGLYVIAVWLLIKTLYFPLILGVMIGELLLWGKLKNWRWGWLGLVLGIYLGTYPTWNESTLIKNSWYAFLPPIKIGWGFEIYHALGAVLILVSLMMLPKIQSWLTKPVWLFLGKTSFALYVVHILIINTLASWLLVTWYGMVNYNVILLLIALTCLPLTVFLAYLINKYIEKPMEKVRIKL